MKVALPRLGWIVGPTLVVPALVAGASLLAATDGQLVYVLDDPYIHMALAKHWLATGVFGPAPGEFAAASSSIAWSGALTAGFAAVGARQALPLILNLVAALWVALAVRHRVARALGNSRRGDWMAAAILLAVPLVPVAFTGLEHLWHLLFSFGLLSAAVEAMRRPHPGRRKLAAGWAALTTATRYEGLFLVGTTAVAAILKRRYRLALWIAGGGLAPVAVAGAIWRALGAGWLPNPILLKGGGALGQPLSGDWTSAVVDWGMDLAAGVPHVLAVMAAAGALMVRAGRRRHPAALPLGLWLGTAGLHCLFADFGWFYRYEAYLIGLGLVVVVEAAAALGWPPRPQNARQWVIAGLVAVSLIVPLAKRSAGAHWRVHIAARNIYEQQVQMGLFLREYYPGARVVVNDVGAVTFLAGVQPVDLGGLATQAVAAEVRLRQQRGEAIPASTLRRLATERQVRIALVYDNPTWWELPAEWVRVERWRIRGNYACASDTVTFLAVGPGEEAALRQALKSFAGRLPAGVERLPLP